MSYFVMSSRTNGKSVNHRSHRICSRSPTPAICLLCLSLVAASILLSSLLWAPDLTSWSRNILSHPSFSPTDDGVVGEGIMDNNLCGFSPSQGTAQEARARGCVYDIISGSWVYPECHDAELGAEFLAHQPPWKWWADEDMKEEISVDEILATGGLNPTGYFVTPEYHDYHYLDRTAGASISSSESLDQSQNAEYYT
ncbi:hypothetical protein DHEL01_v204807 [Diaporthe helianthi]|uniref:Uncharacterized protein n=1 Tax=Diaporthe helianthi TaxID=158607 RepID=A0A2P5I2Q8_DIAHE|nr:hypothetical protein DHEL01_v204807 [Diaporthe helianthi]